jgi:hypothetical protein
MEPPPPAAPPPERRSPSQRVTGVPRAPRAARTDRLFYRWERLSSDQRQAAWSLVEQVRGGVAQEDARRRRQRLLLTVLAALVLALALLIFLLLRSAGGV